MLARGLGWIALVAALGVPRIALALTLGFEPASQVVSVGDPAAVELRISGLGSSVAPSLGVFDLFVSFDPAILSFGGVSFGDPTLGDQLDLFDLGSLTVVDAGLSGAVRLFELSLDSAADLDALQADAFTLATLSFDTLQVGTSALLLSIAALGDAHGAPLSAALETGLVTVVPEPQATLLFLVGLLVVRRATRARATERAALVAHRS
jgi:hypothetical protein